MQSVRMASGTCHRLRDRREPCCFCPGMGCLWSISMNNLSSDLFAGRGTGEAWHLHQVCCWWRSRCPGRSSSGRRPATGGGRQEPHWPHPGEVSKIHIHVYMTRGGGSMVIMKKHIFSNNIPLKVMSMML